jgi:2'-5' RNA ligase
LNETLRTFIAVELPEDIRIAIQQVQQALKKYRLNFRWVRPESIHLTLKFLGNIPPEDIQTVAKTLNDVAKVYDIFELRGSGVGVFPSIKNPRVLWAGVGGSIRTLQSVQSMLDNRLSELGFEKERRPFKGHLTLGRAKGRIDSRQMIDAISACGEFATLSFTVRSLTFFKSDLRKGGPVYSRLAIAPLSET